MFSLRSRMYLRQKCLLNISIQHCIEALPSVTKQVKEIKGIQIGKSKTDFICEWHNYLFRKYNAIYINSTRISEISKFTGHKVNIKNQLCFGGWSKIETQQDPELTSSHEHTESTPIYRAIPPEEGLRAYWTTSAQQMIDHRDKSRRDGNTVMMGTSQLMQQSAAWRDITEGLMHRLTCTMKKIV